MDLIESDSCGISRVILDLISPIAGPPMILSSSKVEPPLSEIGRIYDTFCEMLENNGTRSLVDVPPEITAILIMNGARMYMLQIYVADLAVSINRFKHFQLMG